MGKGLAEIREATRKVSNKSLSRHETFNNNQMRMKSKINSCSSNSEYFLSSC